MVKRTYTLDDPRPVQVDAPYTFFLPDRRRLDAIGPGDEVKAIFRPTTPGTKYEAERMWIKVTRREGDKISGRLANIPDDIPGLKLGDEVDLDLHHVIDVNLADAQKDEQLLFPQRSYWSRCIVDQCVLDREVKVAFVYRDPPELTQDGDIHPDSGWRIRGDWRHTTDEELARRTWAYVALGEVLNVDDSWIHLIDLPEGSAFIRDWEKNEFVPEAG